MTAGINSQHFQDLQDPTLAKLWGIVSMGLAMVFFHQQNMWHDC